MEKDSFSLVIDFCATLQNVGVNVVATNDGEPNSATQLWFIFPDDEVSHHFQVAVVVIESEIRKLLSEHPDWLNIVVQASEFLSLGSANISAFLPRSVRWTNNRGLIRVDVDDKTFFLVVSAII